MEEQEAVEAEAVYWDQAESWPTAAADHDAESTCCWRCC